MNALLCITRLFQVEFAPHVWQSAPDTMVGFVLRSHWVVSSKGNGEKFRYGGWWSVWWTGTYSMVPSKAAFFHKKYFSLYTNEMPRSIREYVTKNRNCEDIAMSILVANATGVPPYGLKDAGNHLIFQEIYMRLDQQELVAWEVTVIKGRSDEYGRMPLAYTTLKAVDSRDTWFWRC